MSFGRRAASWIPASVRGPLAFELRSILGRRFGRTVKLDRSGRHYLNLGSGTMLFDDFVNVDASPPPAGVSAPFRWMDLRYPLRFDRDVFDGVFSEHTLEHLTYVECGRLLRECSRIMKKGARLRVIVPDLSLFLSAWCRNDDRWFREWERLYFTESEDPERRLRRLVTPMSAMSFVTQEYGHVSAWDFITMRAYLEGAGFSEVTRCEYRKGGDVVLLRDADSDERRFVSLYVEAVKATA